MTDISKSEVNRAGGILISSEASNEDITSALIVIQKWREHHAAPLNVFQNTLRKRAEKITKSLLVSQRLKRIPSIKKKLVRTPSMSLSRMQDIGGVRAVVNSIADVRRIEDAYINGKRANFSHELRKVNDYILSPKESGYRSLHLIYTYKSKRDELHNGIILEMQVRTLLQHAWATAVETIGSFTKQALKSSEGEQEWLEYFKTVSAAFALLENANINESLASLSDLEIYDRCIQYERRLKVRDRLSGFVLAADFISDGKNGDYHLVTLDSINKKVSVKSFSKKMIEEASKAYDEAERHALDNPGLDTVLVATDSINSLRKAYPSYFLDSKNFIDALNKIEKRATPRDIRYKPLHRILQLFKKM